MEEFPVHSLVVEKEEREEQRLLARRKLHAERARRFQTDKVRGTDLSSLKLQCEELEARRRAEVAQDREYAAMAAKVQVTVEKQQQSCVKLQQAEMEKLRKEWEQELGKPKNNAPRSDPVDVARCGLASCTLADHDEAEKKHRQTRQMRVWATEQMAEKAAQKDRAQEEEKRFAAWEQHVYERRLKLETQQKLATAEAARKLSEEHAASVAAKAMAREAKKRDLIKAEAAEIERNLADPMLAESKAVDADGRVRVDHFRGFTKGQTQLIYKENQQLEHHRQQLKQQAKDDERAFDRQVSDVESAMHAAEYHKALQHKAQLKDLQADLDSQRKLDAQKKNLSRANAFGTIHPDGIYHGFGRSHR